jgi:GTP-binding protein
VVLELKLLADVGLVGFPNAGKSTLLSRISSAHPKIADYPFTTLEPSLGIVRYKDYQSFVVADIPGLIEGAHDGKGLGIQFLRHIERTRILALLISSETSDLRRDLKILLGELKSFNPTLVRKPKVIVITKTDLVDEASLEALKKAAAGTRLNIAAISAAMNEGLAPLLDLFWQKLKRGRKAKEITKGPA